VRGTPKLSTRYRVEPRKPLVRPRSLTEMERQTAAGSKSQAMPRVSTDALGMACFSGTIQLRSSLASGDKYELETGTVGRVPNLVDNEARLFKRFLHILATTEPECGIRH
jgi:hypothetical protein